MFRIAVLDDWQGVARRSADWSALERRAQVVFFERAIEDADELVRALNGFGGIIAMRERTALPGALIERLEALRIIALTGVRSGTLDLEACTARGVVVCNTGSEHSTTATAELAVALLLAAARQLTAADRDLRAGGFQRGVPLGTVLEGRTLGVAGLGKIGTRLARYGHALGMRVLAWSPNMTPERAQAVGAQAVDKATLFAQSHAVTLHLVLSARTRGVVGAQDLDRMQPNAILVNSARGPLVDETALLERLRAGRLIAALDVFDREPLPRDHPLRTLPNVVLTPHLGYCTAEIYQQFYRESIENLLAFLDGTPIRVMNPQVRQVG
jgi:phosphoglycerate dehydrogenase-like enzyme